MRRKKNIQHVKFTVSKRCHFGIEMYRKLRTGKHYGRTQTSSKGNHEVWLTANQSNWDFTNSFFHEMVHLFLGMYGFRGRLNKEAEEQVAQWIGYHSRLFLCDVLPILRKQTLKQLRREGDGA